MFFTVFKLYIQTVTRVFTVITERIIVVTKKF